MNIASQGLATKPCHVCHPGHRTWRHLLNENFSHLKEITPSPGYLKYWEFFKLTTKAFGPEIFSRDGFQGIRIDRKHGGFGDCTQPCTQSDRLAKHYLVLFSLELVISRGFTQLFRSHQRLNKGTRCIYLFRSVCFVPFYC